MTQPRRLRNIATQSTAIRALYQHLEVGQTLIVRGLTETERDALTPVEGMLIYNSTTDELNIYINGAWESLMSKSLLTDIREEQQNTLVALRDLQKELMKLVLMMQHSTDLDVTDEDVETNA